MDAQVERQFLHALKVIKPKASYQDIDKFVAELKIYDISILTKSEIYNLGADRDEFERGKAEGYDDGYDEGKEDGYEEGYADGKRIAREDND